MGFCGSFHGVTTVPAEEGVGGGRVVAEVDVARARDEVEFLLPVVAVEATVSIGSRRSG